MICSQAFVRLPVLRLVLVVLIGMSPLPASAQIDSAAPTGSHVGVNPDKIGGTEAGDMQKGFGKCVFQVNHQTAVKVLLNGDPLTVDLAAAHLRSSDLSHVLETCLGRQSQSLDFNISASFSALTLRSMLEEAAYLSTNRVAPAPSAVVPTVERKYFSQGPDLAKAQAKAAISDCLISKDAEGADALLRTVPGGTAEHIAAAALARSLGPCLPTGLSFKLTPAVIRSLAGDGLYVRYAQPAMATTYAR